MEVYGVYAGDGVRGIRMIEAYGVYAGAGIRAIRRWRYTWRYT